MDKTDLKKDLKHLYQPSAKEVVQVEVPPLRYLMVDGKGDPGSSPLYAQAVQALFSVAYTAKFMVKKGPQALDYAVMPLEGLWWAEDMSAFATNDRAQWQWTMMILQPDFVADEILQPPWTRSGKRNGCQDSPGCAWKIFRKAFAPRSCT